MNDALMFLTRLALEKKTKEDLVDMLVSLGHPLEEFNELIEKVRKLKDLESSVADLSGDREDLMETNEGLERIVEKLKEQIEDMKCCENCKRWFCTSSVAYTAEVKCEDWKGLKNKALEEENRKLRLVKDLKG